MTRKTWLSIVLVAFALSAGVAACTGGSTESTFASRPETATPTESKGGNLPAAVDAGARTSSADAGPHPCDPLSGVSTPPNTLAMIFGAGRAKDGTVYVLDAPNGVYASPRAFVSKGTALQQRYVYGSGEIGNTQVEASLDDRQIEVEASPLGGPPTRMGVHVGDLVDKTFDIGTEGEQLTLLAASDLAGFTVATSEQLVFVVDFHAVTADGFHLFVTSPGAPISYSQYRVFYGTPAAMLEQKADVNNSSATWISFTDDGDTYAVYLPGGASAPALGGPMLRINLGTPAIQSKPMTYVLPAVDFNLDGGDVDGGTSFAVPRDVGDAGSPTAGLTFLCH